MKDQKRVRTSVILPEDAYENVQAIAAANNVSAAWVIRYAIMRLLETQQRQLELPMEFPGLNIGRRV